MKSIIRFLYIVILIIVVILLSAHTYSFISDLVTEYRNKQATIEFMQTIFEN
jgi:hypothetical protein